MNILLYTNSYLPKIGGREMVVHTLATLLHRRGHDVRVVGPGGILKYRSLKFEYPLDRWVNLPLLTPEQRWRFHLLRTKLLRKFDLIHAHNTFPTGYMAVKLKKQLGVPVVITPHGDDINVSSEIGHGMRLDPEMDRRIRWALSQADAVTSISNQVTLSLKDAGVCDTEITSIPNGVDIARFQSRQTVDVRAHFGLHPESKLIVCVGNYHVRKGHEVLIDAVAKARHEDQSLALLLVGVPKAELEQQSKQRGFSQWLKFTGAIALPDDENKDLLAAILQQAEMSVSSSITSTAEGMSLAVLESMAAECCIVASDISGNADLLAGGAYGVLVPPNNRGALAKAILDLSRDPERIAALKHAAKKRALQFSWEAITDQYESLYRRVLSDSCDRRQRLK